MKHLTSIATAIIVAFMILCATSAVKKSATVDEYAHLAAGLYAWRTADFSLYGKTPPAARMIETLPALLLRPNVPLDTARLRGEAWLPWTYATWFQLENQDHYDRILRVARQTVIILGMLLCAAVFFASRARYGDTGGLVSVTAAALSPTLIAHSQLVTTDVACALFFFSFCLLLLRYLKAPRAAHLILMAMAAALAVLSKFSMLFLAPLLAAAPFGAWAWRRRWKKDDESAGPPVPFGMALAHLPVIAIIGWFMVFACYFGRNVDQNRDKLWSRNLNRVAPVLKVVPLPREFVRGLDLQLLDAERGEWESGNYLLGRRYAGSKWYYYLIAVVAKEPVPYLVALLVALGFIARKPRFDEAVLAGIAALYFLIASGFGSLQIGIRYLLPIYPIGFLLLGRLGEYVSRQSPAPLRFRQAVAIGLGVAGLWAAAANLRIWPDYLAYFSPVVGGPDHGRKVLLDSNLDWGQDLPGLAEWMRDHGVRNLDLVYFGHDNPRRFGINFSLPGRGSGNQLIAISANYLEGTDYPMTFVSTPLTKDDPMWIIAASYRDKTPVAVIGHTISVFEQGRP